MKASDQEHQIINYLEGNLPEAERLAFEKSIAKSAALQQQVQEYQQLIRGIDQLEEQLPSSQLDQRFEQFLAVELDQANEVPVHNLRSSSTSFYQKTATIAAAVALLACGLAIGWLLSNQSNQKAFSDLHKEIASTKSIVLELLQQESASNRIKAINISQDMKQTDQDIINILIHTMNTDQSTNVQLAAIEALSHFPESSLVRQALIKALSQQKNPVLQIELITVLVNIREQKAIQQLDKLIENETTTEKVKDEARLGRSKLQRI